MNSVVEFKVVANYKIWLKFEDREEKIIDFYPYLQRGFARELLDPKKFENVFIEPGGGLAWENGYDFCPNFLKQLKSETDMVSN